MLTLLLQAAGQRQKLLLTLCFCQDDIGHLRLAAGDGAGLIQCHNIHLARFLQGNRSLKHNAMLCAHAVAHHNGNRSRKPQCTRTADDQNGNAPGQRKAHALASQQPYNGCNDCNSNNSRYKHTGYPVGNLCDRRLGGSRITDHLDDLGQSRIFSDSDCLAADKAGLVYRCRGNTVTYGLIHRDALTGEGCLVHGTASF